MRTFRVEYKDNQGRWHFWMTVRAPNKAAAETEVLDTDPRCTGTPKPPTTRTAGEASKRTDKATGPTHDRG